MSNWTMSRRRRRMGTHRIAILETVVMLEKICPLDNTDLTTVTVIVAP